MRKIAVLGAVALLLAGCGGGPEEVAVGTAVTVEATDIAGAEASYKVTLAQIHDPATPKGAASPDKRFVAPEFDVKGGDGTVKGNANLSATLAGSDGTTYNPDITMEVEQCNNFNNGSFLATPGVGPIGCVVFKLPKDVTVESVKWTVIGGGTAQWAVQ